MRGEQRARGAPDPPPVPFFSFRVLWVYSEIGGAVRRSVATSQNGRPCPPPPGSVVSAAARTTATPTATTSPARTGRPTRNPLPCRNLRPRGTWRSSITDCNSARHHRQRPSLSGSYGAPQPRQHSDLPRYCRVGWTAASPPALQNPSAPTMLLGIGEWTATPPIPGLLGATPPALGRATLRWR